MASTKSHLHGSGLPSTKGHAKLLIQLPGQDNKVRKAREVKSVTCSLHISYYVSAHCTLQADQR